MEELSSEEMFGADFGAERMWGLKEAMLPAESFSPQTIAWLYLGGLVAALLLIYCWRRYQYWKRQAYRREALHLLAAMKVDASLISALPQLLRYAALMTVAREEVSVLKGQDWIDWLNQQAGKSLFHDEDAALLKRLAYAREASIDAQQSQHLIAATQAWIEASHA